jgi:hypothetical protein
LIGIISSFSDLHASTVLGHLGELGADAVVLDTGLVPSRATLTSQHTSDDPWRAAWIEDPEGDRREYDLTSLRAVWWRRPQPHELHQGLTAAADRRFAYREVDAAVRGLWSCTDATWVNDPERDLAASRKLWQLKVAAQLGLRIPRTCATTDPIVAREFIEQERHRSGAIFKPFGGDEEAWAETRLVEHADVQNLDQVRFAPVIFQEFIPGGIDIRATMIGRDAFAAEIRAVDTAYEFDFRVDCGNAPIAPHALPSALVDRLRSLLDRLSLLYGAIDLRVAPDGDYVFLEINPAGQWLFAEYAAEQPISAAMAHLLRELDTHAARHPPGTLATVGRP